VGSDGDDRGVKPTKTERPIGARDNADIRGVE